MYVRGISHILRYFSKINKKERKIQMKKVLGIAMLISMMATPCFAFTHLEAPPVIHPENSIPDMVAIRAEEIVKQDSTKLLAEGMCKERIADFAMQKAGGEHNDKH